MKAYKFSLRIGIHGTMSTVYRTIDISSIGENEEEAYNKLKESLSIVSIDKLSVRLL